MHSPLRMIDTYSASEWKALIEPIQECTNKMLKISEGSVPNNNQTPMQFLINETKSFVKEFILNKDNGQLDKFWVRKSNKTVLAIVMVKLNEKQIKNLNLSMFVTHECPKTKDMFVYIKSRNMEVSLPCGSHCAERGAIQQALSRIMTLKREQIKAIAICDPTFELPGLQPCGLCSEYIKKIEEISDELSIITFPLKNVFNVFHEKQRKENELNCTKTNLSLIKMLSKRNYGCQINGILENTKQLLTIRAKCIEDMKISDSKTFVEKKNDTKAVCVHRPLYNDLFFANTESTHNPKATWKAMDNRKTNTFFICSFIITQIICQLPALQNLIQ